MRLICNLHFLGGPEVCAPSGVRAGQEMVPGRQLCQRADVAVTFKQRTECPASSFRGDICCHAGSLARWIGIHGRTMILQSPELARPRPMVRNASVRSSGRGAGETTITGALLRSGYILATATNPVH